MPENTEQMLTVVEVAERLSVNPHSVRRLIYDKLLPAMTLRAGSKYLVRESDLSAYIKSRTTEPHPVAASSADD